MGDFGVDGGDVVVEDAWIAVGGRGDVAGESELKVPSTL
jgi:hypothetical protein